MDRRTGLEQTMNQKKQREFERQSSVRGEGTTEENVYFSGGVEGDESGGKGSGVSNCEVLSVSWIDGKGVWQNEVGTGTGYESSFQNLLLDRKRAVEKRVFGEGSGVITSDKVSLKKTKLEDERKGPSTVVKEKKRNLARPGGVLENPVILKNVVSYVTSVGDLKAFRSVCKLWRDEAMSSWRKKAVLVLRNPVLMVLLRAYVHEEEVEEELPKLREYPFRNFRFHDTVLWTYPLSERDEEVERKRKVWIKILGPHAKFIDIGRSKLDASLDREGRVTFLPGLHWILNCAPVLKELRMDPVCTEDATTSMELDLAFKAPSVTTLFVPESTASSFEARFFENPLDLKGFLQMIPNLKNVLGFDCSVLGTILKILTRGFNNQEEEGNRQLEKLESFGFGEVWHHQFTNAVIEYLQKYKNVKELCISLDIDVMLRKNMEGYKILSLVSASIEKLNLNIVTNFGTPSNSKLFMSKLVFPNLTQLTLRIEYKDRDATEGIVFPFEVFANIPKLQRFVFECMPFDAVKPPIIDRLKIRDSSPGFQLRSLTHFRFYGGFRRLALKELGAVCPNIRYLQVAVLKENVQVLISMYNNLQNLRQMYGSKLCDNDIQQLTSSLPSLKITRANR